MVKVVRQNLAQNRQQFARISRQLNQLLGDKVTIEHIGSTAVPGLIGKNIIDVLIGVKSASQTRRVADQLIKAGWFAGKRQNDEYCFLASRVEETGAGDFHLHIAPIDGRRYWQFLEVRQFLQQNSNWRRRYNQVKHQLARELQVDRAAYKRLKSRFVEQVLDQIAQKPKQ